MSIKTFLDWTQRGQNQVSLISSNIWRIWRKKLKKFALLDFFLGDKQRAEREWLFHPNVIVDFPIKNCSSLKIQAQDWVSPSALLDYFFRASNFKRSSLIFCHWRLHINLFLPSQFWLWSDNDWKADVFMPMDFSAHWSTIINDLAVRTQCQAFFTFFHANEAGFHQRL